ncbi:MAG TPA: hypothetical protein VGQ83_38820 [Polyangia bacterium]|jgi:hypothetical protein
MPDGAQFDAPYLLVCFNDECEYYVRGWAFMEQSFGRRVSYRHYLNPANGATGPLPVWSPAALKSHILPDEGGDDDDPQ